MDKEIEDTIINDEEQLKELHNKIDKLNIKIKEKDDIIKTYEDTFSGLNLKIKDLERENDELRNLLDDNKIPRVSRLDNNHISIDIDEGIKDKENKRLEKELNDITLLNKKLSQDKKELQEEYKRIQDETKINIEEDLKYREMKDKYEELLYEKEKQKNIDEEKDDIIKKLKEDIKSFDINKIKQDLKKEIESDIQSKNKVIKRNIQKKDKISNIETKMLDKYSVKIYNINSNTGNTELLEFVSSECSYNIKFNKLIGSKIKDITGKDLDIEKDELTDNIWEDIFKFKVENGELKGTRQEKLRLKYKITRCNYLYHKYGGNLSKFNIYLSHLELMTDVEWNRWIGEFDVLFNEVFKGSKICNYIYSNNNKCSIYNCKIKHKDNI